jgi:hypothetical protein
MDKEEDDDILLRLPNILTYFSKPVYHWEDIENLSENYGYQWLPEQ